MFGARQAIRAHATTVVGAVEKVGPKTITGWIAVDPGKPAPAIRLLLNGVHLAETSAGRKRAGGGEGSGFAFTVAGIWGHFGAGDALEVRVDGAALPFADGATAHVFDKPLTSRSSEILAKTKAGWLLDRKGYLRFPISENATWTRETFALFDEIAPIVKRVTGAELTPSYGTLLGCVRAGEFIKHDDDFDTSYLSSFTAPEDVRDEVVRLFQAFVDAGYSLRTGVMDPNLIKVSKNKRSVDIFYAWFDENDEYGISYGYHGGPVKKADYVMGTRLAKLAGRDVLVPKSAELLLEQFYGPGWRVPDHGFSHKSSTRRMDQRYILDRHTSEKLYWNAFYAQNALKDASSFAKLVQTKIPENCLLIDVGCGTGKDAVFFGENGVATIGVDASPEGIKRASALGAERGVRGLDFQVVDVGSDESLEALFSCRAYRDGAAAGKPVVVYMRFFLHSIKDPVEAVLFGALKRHLPAGARLMVEFRTDQDKDLPKAVKAKHFRRYMKPAAFAQRLEDDYGFKVTYREESFGWSIYKDEDPHLCRLFAEKA